MFIVQIYILEVALYIGSVYVYIILDNKFAKIKVKLIFKKYLKMHLLK